MMDPSSAGGTLCLASRLFLDADTVVSPGALAFRDGVVLAAGRPDDAAGVAGPEFRRLSLPGTAILPGLVNAHTHLEIPRLGGYAGGTASPPPSFVDWLIRIIAWKRGALPGEFADNFRAAAAAALASGTTAVGEIAGPDPGAYAGSPLRARIFAEGIGFLPGDAQQAVTDVRKTLARLRKAAASGPVVPGVSPHALYTVGPGLLCALGELSAREALPVCLHLAESPAEMAFLRNGAGEIATRLYPFVGKDVSWFRGLGTGIPAWLGMAGLLREGLLLVHNVHLSPADIEALRAGGARFVLCPRSNGAHGNGSPDVTRFIDGGIPFALGTDSLASVPTVSLWDEMRAAGSLYRGRFREESLGRLLLRAATRSGAEALGLPGGVLRPGSPADFIAVDDPGGEDGPAAARLIARTGAGNVRLAAVAGLFRHGPP